MCLYQKCQGQSTLSSNFLHERNIRDTVIFVIRLTSNDLHLSVNLFSILCKLPATSPPNPQWLDPSSPLFQSRLYANNFSLDRRAQHR